MKARFVGVAVGCLLLASLARGAQEKPRSDGGVDVDPANLISICGAANEPVSVVATHARARAEASSRSGSPIADLIVEVTNRSDKPVSYIRYTLDPPDRCPGWSHPFSYWVWYGQPVGPSHRKIPGTAGPPVAPGKKVELVLRGVDLEFIRWKGIQAKCHPGAKSDLTIAKVAFTDGTGWEGFADGPNHDQWNGRPWTPPPATQEKPKKGH